MVGLKLMLMKELRCRKGMNMLNAKIMKEK